MNSDDYENKKRTQRIAVRRALPPKKMRFVTITSGKEGTKIYLDGQLSRTKKDLVLEVPNGSEKTRLVIANSVCGRHAWTGDIYGLALYGRILTAKDAELHFEQWLKERNFSFARKDVPKLLYIFDEKAGERVFDHSGGNHHLEIPPKMEILKREILVAPWHRIKLNRSSVQDIVINIFGFIPFGFFLAATFLSTGGFVGRHSVIITVLLCLVISLIIEIAQAWMPSRSSDTLDVILNTLGGWLGAVVHRAYSRLSPKATRQSY